MKIFINDAKEDWIVDRFKKEFSEYNQELFTNEVQDADIIWIIAPWSWKKIYENKKSFMYCASC